MAMTSSTKDGLAAYQRINVETQSEPRLLVDLCDRAAVAIDTARGSDDVVLKRSSLQRAREIIVFLQDSLSVECGGVVTVNVFRHYTYLARKLMEAQTDPASADLNLLYDKFSELRDTWSEAVRIVEEQQSDEQA